MSLVVERGGKLETIYEPLPHQKQFHESPRRFVLMGGGRGSGKSKAIRFDAYMRCMMIPRFRTLIVRRSMPELKQSHLNYVVYEAEQLGLGRDAWHATDNVLRWPNGSSTRFGHAEDDNSIIKYLSSEYERIYFDELATFTLRQFLFLCSSLRSPIKGYVPGVGCGTNPVGPGASWVKRFFIDKNPSQDEAPDYDAGDYEYIHSTMDDNTHVDRDAYARILNAMPSDALRRALRHGEWVIEGQAFGEWREKTDDGKPWHVIDTPPLYRGKPVWDAKHIEIVRVVDWGYAPTGNPGACHWFACLPDHSAVCFKEWYFRETLPADVAAEIKRLSQGMKVRYTVGDNAMWQEHEGPSIAESFAKAGLSMIEADKRRENGWVELHTWLRETVTDVSGEKVTSRPRLTFYRDGCPKTIQSIPQMLTDPKNPMDIVTIGVEDEGADNARYFVMSRPGKSVMPKATPETAWIHREIAKRRRIGQRLGTEATRRAA